MGMRPSLWCYGSRDGGKELAPSQAGQSDQPAPADESRSVEIVLAEEVL